MKSFFTSIFLILSILANAQKATSLSEYYGSRAIKEGQAAIYGNFVQRLDFSSGGLLQEVMI